MVDAHCRGRYGETGGGRTDGRGATGIASRGRNRNQLTADDDIAQGSGPVAADRADILPIHRSIPSHSAQADVDVIAAAILYLHTGAGRRVN